ncbi:SNF2-related protein [Variovorax sp. RCC_210]|uniref:C-terminal helicase domain-containing protein n=1 Tax=Variovorax sp. RCC_210 TaxID=3239217 RepID=UPI003524390D
MTETLLPEALTAGQLQTFIDFDGGGGEHACSAQGRAQSEGVAALWHLLRTKGFGYLADEVGMGKTRQAMAVIALQILEDPLAQIVIVCPGRTLQEQWLREWDAFIRTCYLAADDRLRSARTGKLVSPVALHDRLSDFALALQHAQSRIHLLRYSSFSRPLSLGGSGAQASAAAGIFEAYRLALVDLAAVPSEEDMAAFANAASSGEAETEHLAVLLNNRYAQQLGNLLCARGISLAIFDEAQYLRHVGNQQNKHILQIFRPHARRWLFLSATPLHSGTQSLACLDAYLATGEAQAGRVCACLPVDRSPAIARRLKRDAPQSVDVVEIMREFMVRRIRAYEDAERERYVKTTYRRYERVKISGARDPFTALTMALVQKRLVVALDGRHNRFRQGECSSFESLASSLRTHRQRQRQRQQIQDRDEAKADAEFEHRQDGGPAAGEESLDRMSIDALAQSFNASAADHRLGGQDAGHASVALPHAKLSDAVKRVFQRSLSDASTHKTLIFVRRLDTVEELRDGLLLEFQKAVDHRLSVWRDWLHAPPSSITLREPAWKPSRFWSTPSHPDDDGPDDIEPQDASDAPSELNGGEAAPVAGSLDYFAAIQEKGKLHSFQSRLRDRTFARNPLRGFLQTRPVDSGGQDETAWAAVDRWWERLVVLCMGEEALALAGSNPSQHWLLGPVVPGSSAYWKRATLQRCLLQSMRQTDLLVDLYVLRRYVVLHGADGQALALPDILLRFLGEKSAEQGEALFPSQLNSYAANWREKFRRWIVNFDTIVDKCLRAEGVTEWREIHAKAYSAFDRMQPVFGRSGRVNDSNAVTQFKFPTHPNVLVCTDVLKEGVDLHLFCDEVVHYGVAWTSGDLEQRIGRVDRFGSQISRRLAAYRRSSDAEPLPRLQVEFPYLDGTLDAAQVARVILAKVRSDLRMDMGRRREDMGQVSLDDLLTPASQSHLAGSAPLPAGFYPEHVPADAPGAKPEAPVLIAPLLRARGLSATPGVHLPRLGAMRWRSELSSSPRPVHALLRTVRVPRSRKRFTSQAEWLATEGHPDTAGDVAAALRAAGPVSVIALAGDHAFGFSSRSNTLVCTAVVDQPLAPSRFGEQAVMLESLGGFWLLRSFLLPADERHDAAWLADGSRELAWAYLARSDGAVWLLMFARKSADEAEDGVFLGRLASQMGALAGCLRSSLKGADEGEPVEPCTFRSRASFPSLDASVVCFSDEQGEAMVDSLQWQQAGRFLSRLEDWFRGAFSDVCEALEIDISPSDLAMVMHEDGRLQLATQGAGRVRLQAFLQFDPATGPWIGWEFVGALATTGAIPVLEPTAWEYMPHQCMEGWSGEAGGECEVYVSAGERHRYVAVYHRPQAWDRHRLALMAAWKEVPGRTRGINFQKQALRQSFLLAVERTSIQQEGGF